MPKPVFNALPLQFKHDDGYFDGDKGFTFFNLSTFYILLAFTEMKNS